MKKNNELVWVHGYGNIPTGVYMTSENFPTGCCIKQKPNYRFFVSKISEFYKCLPVTKVWCCEKCGSTNVEEKRWFNVNTEEIGDTCSDGDTEDNYCNSCGEYSQLILLSEYLNKQDEKE